ncbi:MAG: tetratricopeptide repeat protein [Desulfosarcina sp.]|nr:tetratricopeptide repeat protein [Desulfosarcina sp.]MBC2743971.1 tetratricopeptide repeat protein [Desulfosarcina sp.]MBC2766880.1 tetratricopeptide repeat protein [Desulfosarcina sp.]
MARQSPDLFKNRSATQEFLFSHSDDIIDDGNAEKVLTSRDSAGTAPYSAHFSDMLDRQELIHAIDTHMASASTLCAITVRVEWAAGMKSDNVKGTDIPEDAVTPIATVCRVHSGTWARIGRDRFACLFPHLTAVDGQVLAQNLLNAFSEAKGPPITIGVAAYPTLNYTRSQIVENAEKALEHAGFFGPGTITVFDSVSLNISGDRHYQAGDIAGAIGEFKKGLLLNSSDANLHNSLGVCYGVLKDYDNALTAFENAIWLAPEEVMAIYNKGIVLLYQGNGEQALECFLEADAQEPNVFEVVFHIGQAFMEMGATKKARPYLEAATRANSRSGPAFKSFGACLDTLELTKEAIQAYKSAIKINPGDAESLSILGRLYTKRGESLDVASVLCEQSVRLSPDNGLFRHRLGHVYLNLGKLGHALAEFELAVALGHDSQPQIEETQDRMMAAKAS